MNILQINKFYHIVGGVDRYYLELGRQLEKRGHDLAYFSMLDKRNKKTEWSKYFVSNASFDKPYMFKSLKLFFRMVYFQEARRKISRLLDNFTPDVAHVHHIYHQISPSILFELKKRKIPIIHSVSDFHLISPHHNNLFHEDHICEVSKNHKYYMTVLNKCIKNSYIASLAEAVEQYFHYFSGVYLKNIDVFISPSNFMTSKLKEYGIPNEKLTTLPFFIDSTHYETKKVFGEYILYFGRLYNEKGLLFLLKIISLMPEIKLIIAGDGPIDSELKNEIILKKYKNIKIINKFIPEFELNQLIADSRFVIFPSQSYETFGISILEAYATGKTVIASRIGALPEIVKHGETGFLCESGNKEEFQEHINILWHNPELCRKLGMQGRELVERFYNPQIHYQKLMRLYKDVINSII